jgi:hypothetical protein
MPLLRDRTVVRVLKAEDSNQHGEKQRAKLIVSGL